MEILDDIKKHPLFRIVLPFIGGIILALIFKPNYSTAIVISSSFIFIIFGFLLYKFSSSFWNTNWMFGVFVNLVFLWFGFICASQNDSTSRLKLGDSCGEIVGLVNAEPQVKENSIQLTVRVEAYRLNNTWYSTDGFIQLYLEKDDEAILLQPGDRIVFSPELEQYKNAGNPKEFDYEKYLWHHLIAYSDYLSSNEWVKTDTYDKNHLQRIASSIRNRIIYIYRDNGLEGDELAVASALTLGNKSSLNDRVRQSYSISGGMHVLAVSGLHVGIVFVVINFLLSFIRNKKYQWIKILLIILLIWSYAFITGLSPSVTRASIMFSLFAIGKLMKQSPGFLNILSASAFISLLINPYAITEIGFQLSYVAVGSIVFFYPRIYNLFVFKLKVWDKLWSLISVSIAAQIGTLPLTLFYFNQFSNYFILTNILLIPLVSIAIYLAILLIIVSPIPVIAGFIGKIFSYVIKFMNQGVFTIEQLPGSSSKVYIDSFQFILIITMILLTLIILEYRKSKLVFPLLVCAILLLGDSMYNKISTSKQRDIVVYNIRNTSAINFIDGSDNILLTGLEENISSKGTKQLNKYWISRGLSNEKIVYKEHMNPEHILRNIVSVNNPHTFVKYGFVGFHNIRLVLVGEEFSNGAKPEAKIKVDYVIVTGYGGEDTEFIKNSFDFKYLIIDSSVSDDKADEIYNEFMGEGYNVYCVKKSGAFLHSGVLNV